MQKRRVSQTGAAGRGLAEQQPAARRPGAVVAAPDTLLVNLLGIPLESLWDVTVRGSGTTVAAAALVIAAERPDLLIATADLPDAGGLTLLPALAKVNPQARAIVIAGGPALARVRREASSQPLIHAVVDVAGGLGALAGEVGRWLESLGHVPLATRLDTMLSPREMDVFKRIGRGQPSAAIAAALAISQQTVETHRKSITKKAGVKGAGLVRLAVLHGISTIHEADGASPSVG